MKRSRTNDRELPFGLTRTGALSFACAQRESFRSSESVSVLAAASPAPAQASTAVTAARGVASRMRIRIDLTTCGLTSQSWPPVWSAPP
jgi:hypothetical protein